MPLRTRVRSARSTRVGSLALALVLGAACDRPAPREGAPVTPLSAHANAQEATRAQNTDREAQQGTVAEAPTLEPAPASPPQRVRRPGGQPRPARVTAGEGAGFDGNDDALTVQRGATGGIGAAGAAGPPPAAREVAPVAVADRLAQGGLMGSSTGLAAVGGITVATGRVRADRDEAPREASPLVAIDPNGRFATTYRPGAGHLSAFEAAVNAGIVPASTRELVADVGARYAPDLAAPTEGALAFRADLERAALPPAGGLLHLRLALRSTERAAEARPRMSVHLVLDHSGSMSGRPMDDALAAARMLVERLEPTDTFSLTAFSSNAEVLVPAGPVGPRRAVILSRIAAITADGGTNIGEGLSRGYEQAARGPQSADTVKIVMLLSDGRATDGEVNPRVLAGLSMRAFQDGVQTSSFGVGTDYDGPLMSSIADRGAGGYYYLRETSRIGEALTTELDLRAQPVAQAVEVRVRLRDGVELVQTYGARRLDDDESAAVRAQEVALDQQVARRDRIAQNRQQDREGGMRLFLPGFARSDRHAMLLGLRLGAGAGERPLALVELRYKDRITGRNVTTEVPLRVRYAQSDAESLASVDPSVARTVQGFDAGETLDRAARAVERGAPAEATALLQEREAILRASAARMGEPRFAEDAARLARFRGLLAGEGSRTGERDPLVLALLLETSARGYMH